MSRLHKHGVMVGGDGLREFFFGGRIPRTELAYGMLRIYSRPVEPYNAGARFFK